MSVVSRIKCLFGKTSPTGTTLNLSSEVSKTEECHDQRLLLMGVIRAEAACLCEAHHIVTPAHVAGGAIELVQAMLAEHRDTAAEELPGIAIGGLSAFIYEWDRGMRSRGEMAMGDCGRSLVLQSQIRKSSLVMATPGSGLVASSPPRPIQDEIRQLVLRPYEAGEQSAHFRRCHGNQLFIRAVVAPLSPCSMA